MSACTVRQARSCRPGQGACLHAPEGAGSWIGPSGPLTSAEAGPDAEHHVGHPRRQRPELRHHHVRRSPVFQSSDGDPAHGAAAPGACRDRGGEPGARSTGWRCRRAMRTCRRRNSRRRFSCRAFLPPLRSRFSPAQAHGPEAARRRRRTRQARAGAPGHHAAAIAKPNQDYVATRMLHRSRVVHHLPMTETVERVYFAVLDESGRSFPAVEYWAGLIDEGAELGAPMRRFVKLIGPDESLSELEAGVFQGLRSRRRYVRCPHAAIS